MPTPSRIRAAVLGTPVTLALVLAVAGAVGAGSGPVLQRTITLAIVNVILVVGLYTFTGLTGIISFGQVAFSAVGAYAYALAAMPPALKATLLPVLPEAIADAHLPIPVALLLGALAGGLVAGVFSVMMLRLSGLTAGIATLAVLVLVYTIVSNWDEVTRGMSGLVGIPTGTDVLGVTAIAVGVVALAWLLKVSRFGRMVIASSADDAMARSVGVRVRPFRSLSYTISGAFSALGGAVYASVLGALSPDTFYFALTLTTVAMLVIGGTRSLSGAVIGPLLVATFQEVLRVFRSGVQIGEYVITGPAGLVQLGTAALLLLILLFRREGIMGSRELSIDRGLRGLARAGARRRRGGPAA